MLIKINRKFHEILWGKRVKRKQLKRSNELLGKYNQDYSSYEVKVRNAINELIKSEKKPKRPELRVINGGMNNG